MKNSKHSEAEINEKAIILINLEPAPIGIDDYRILLVPLPFRNKVVIYKLKFIPIYNVSQTNWFGSFKGWRQYGCTECIISCGSKLQ
jgi:hypothetical protein